MQQSPTTPAQQRASAVSMEAAKMEAVLEDAKERGGLRHLKPQPDWKPRLKAPVVGAATSAAVTTAPA